MITVVVNQGDGTYYPYNFAEWDLASLFAEFESANGEDEVEAEEMGSLITSKDVREQIEDAIKYPNHATKEELVKLLEKLNKLDKENRNGC